MRGTYAANKTLAVALLLAGFFSTPVCAEEVSTPISIELKAPEPFGLDEKLKPRVYFWIDVYAKYNSWQSILHDHQYPQVVYEVLDRRSKTSSVASARKKYAQILMHLQRYHTEIEAGKTKLSADEQRIFDLFKEIPGEGKFAAAASAKRMRTQAGLRDHLLDALFMSGRYLYHMEKVFKSFGLPPQIAYLPFVESGFNHAAISRVGASGIWQFMPYTGKQFLRVDDVVDDRNDPMRAADAAARLMKLNFDTLHDWALAITAYNHGTTGIARAVKEVGSTSLAEIIEKYESSSFGYASENYYASFLAALHVAANSAAYLGEVPRAKKLEFDEFVVPHYVEMKTLISFLKLDEAEVRELNPGLTKKVYEGKKLIPVGYTLRVPFTARENFLQKYDAIPKELKFSSQKMEQAPAVVSPVLSPALDKKSSPYSAMNYLP